MSKIADNIDIKNTESLAKLLGGISGGYDYSTGAAPGEFGHYTDAGKLPHHPTFSDESAYADKVNPGGTWKLINKKWVYTPSQKQLQTNGYEESLARYFVQEYGKGIDKVEYPVPYKTPEKFKGK